MPTTLTITPWIPPNSATSYSVLTVFIDSYKAEPVLAADQNTPTAERITISGHGVVTAADWDGLRTGLQSAGRRCNAVTLVEGGTDLVKLERSTSSMGGPIVSLSASEIDGAGLALVRFEISDERVLNDLPVAAHTWTQRIALDATGRMTRTIAGNLVVNRASSASTVQPADYENSSWTSTVPWADLFRRAAVPLDVPAGCRRESQEYALDDRGTTLHYSVIDKQYAHNLPDGVRVGDMDFSYERTLENAAVANVTFTCDLEGGLDLFGIPTNAYGLTGNRLLVAAAVELSKTRINANLSTILIQRMRVTEKNILSGFAIRFELEAQILPNSSVNPQVTTLQPLGSIIGRQFSVTRTTAQVDPYGVARPVYPGNAIGERYVMVQHYLRVAGANVTASPVNLSLVKANPIDGTSPAPIPAIPMPKAQVVVFGEAVDTATGIGAAGKGPSTAGSPGLASVYILEENSAQTMEGMNYWVKEGKYAGARTDGNQSANATPGEIVTYVAASTRLHVKTGFTIASKMHNEGEDMIFQTSHPRVTVRERVEIVRVNKAPERVMRPLFAGSIAIEETWDVSLGKFDAQGNRQFVGVYERVSIMRDVGGAAAGQQANATYFQTVNQGEVMKDGSGIADAFGDYRSWVPNERGITVPLVPTMTDKAQEPTRAIVDGLQDPANLDTNYAQGSVNMSNAGKFIGNQP